MGATAPRRRQQINAFLSARLRHLVQSLGWKRVKREEDCASRAFFCKVQDLEEIGAERSGVARFSPSSLFLFVGFEPHHSRSIGRFCFDGGRHAKLRWVPPNLNVLSEQSNGLHRCRYPVRSALCYQVYSGASTTRPYDEYTLGSQLPLSLALVPPARRDCNQLGSHMAPSLPRHNLAKGPVLALIGPTKVQMQDIGHPIEGYKREGKWKPRDTNRE